MTFVIPFRGYRPSPRSDGIKWINAHAQEAAPGAQNEPGAFATVESIPIPDYPDPTNPPVLNLTTDLGTLRPGWYRLRFTDTGTGEEFTAPRWWGAEGYRPSTRQVALHIKNRTVDDLNNFIGDFTDETVVTGDEVEELIVKAEQRILRRLDVDSNEVIPTESHQAISEVIALYAAMLVELTKFGEQIQANRSPYIHLRDLFIDQMKELLEDVRGIAATDDGGGGSKSVWDLVATQENEASFAFPDPFRVNWETQF